MQEQNKDLFGSKPNLNLNHICRMNNQTHKIICDSLSSKRTKVEFRNDKYEHHENNDAYDESQASSPKTLILRARDFESSRNQLKHFSISDKNKLQSNLRHNDFENRGYSTDYRTINSTKNRENW